MDAPGGPDSPPTGVGNRWGYHLEFDEQGKLGDLQIDFETMAAHLAAIVRATESRGTPIWRVIFDPELQPFWHQTAVWPAIGGAFEFFRAPFVGTARRALPHRFPDPLRANALMECSRRRSRSEVGKP